MIIVDLGIHNIRMSITEKIKNKHSVPESKRSLKSKKILTFGDSWVEGGGLTSRQNKNYYDLIEQFYKVTDVPIIFNTSFNLGGEPLVETIYDAIDTCNRSEINYIYVPEDQDINIPYSMILPKEFGEDEDDG